MVRSSPRNFFNGLQRKNINYLGYFVQTDSKTTLTLSPSLLPTISDISAYALCFTFFINSMNSPKTAARKH